MAKPFDATLKDLIETYPADWLPFVGLPTSAPVDVVDADVSTVTAAADKVLRVREATPWLLHIEFQSSPRSDPAEPLHWYNTLLGHRHRLPIRTVLVLLQPSADSPALGGVYQKQFPGEMPYLMFAYRVVRVWQVPAAELLAGGLGVLPLAPLGAVGEGGLPEVVRRLDERLVQDATAEQAAILGTAAATLTGLRLEAPELIQLYQGVRFMSILEESSFLQVVQGKEAKKIILRLGRKRFGPPDDAAAAALEAIWDVERLERMSERLLDANSWAEVLATP